MKLNPRIISQLALMICGDEQYKDIFPYRSSSYLTQFFRSINLNYIHDGSTRRWWVQKILDDLNVKVNDIDEKFPSSEIIKIIEQLLHRAEFTPINTDRQKAITMMNELLGSEGFFIDIDTNTKNGKLKKYLGEFISTALDEKKVERVITFSPNVFSIPNKTVNPNLVSVMMPFSQEFDLVYDTIKMACRSIGMEYQRVDEIWINSAIIQDIFDLIFTSTIVIADLSGKNPNVFYEMGIAHALGKNVIPIVLNNEGMSFDVKHHRTLKYENTTQGRSLLQSGLESRLMTLYEDIKKENK
jgi:predicted transcriptional regulator